MVERTRLSVIVHPGDRQDRQGQLGGLLTGWIVGIPIRIEGRGIDPFLKNGRRVADETVELAVRSAGFDPAAEQPNPEGVVIKNTGLLGPAARGLTTGCRKRSEEHTAEI